MHSEEIVKAIYELHVLDKGLGILMEQMNNAKKELLSLKEENKKLKEENEKLSKTNKKPTKKITKSKS